MVCNWNLRWLTFSRIYYFWCNWCSRFTSMETFLDLISSIIVHMMSPIDFQLLGFSWQRIPWLVYWNTQGWLFLAWINQRAGLVCRIQGSWTIRIYQIRRIWLKFSMDIRVAIDGWKCFRPSFCGVVLAFSEFCRFLAGWSAGFWT